MSILRKKDEWQKVRKPMFNNYSVNPTQTLNISAVSGTIVKNCKDSFIVKFHTKSRMAETLLDANPRMKKRDDYEDAVVLQVMLCGEQELMAEVMWKKDFDKMFKPELESEG